MEQLPLAQVDALTGAEVVTVLVSLEAGVVAGAAWVVLVVATAWPQVPPEQVETVLQEPPLQPRLRRPPALTSVPIMPATAKASANSFKVFMTNSPSNKVRD